MDSSCGYTSNIFWMVGKLCGPKIEEQTYQETSWSKRKAYQNQILYIYVRIIFEDVYILFFHAAIPIHQRNSPVCGLY